MVTVKDAVKGAGQFVSELFPDAKNLRLEQVESGGPLWRVVMSFQLGEPSGLAAVIGHEGRLFKEVDVDADTGEGTALRMWKL
jgi:hypothetical protein